MVQYKIERDQKYLKLTSETITVLGLHACFTENSSVDFLKVKEFEN